MLIFIRIKRLFAITLIFLLAFNWYGYRLLIGHLQQEANTALQAKLDKNAYDPASLVEIRVPLNMPYITDWDEFETCQGETEINGTHYKYVKRKVERGQLVLLCIPNQQKTTLEGAKDAYFKLTNDLQQPQGKKSTGDHASKSISDYIVHELPLTGLHIPTQQKAQGGYSCFTPSAFIATPAQPPEAC